MAKPRLRRSYRLVFRLLLLILLISGACVCLWGYGEYTYRFQGVVNRDVTLKFYPDSIAIADVAAKLESEGVISSGDEFVEVAKDRGITAFQAGRYRFASGESYRQLLNKFRFGQESPVMVTFNNIRTVEQLSGILGRRLMADSLEFLNHFRSEANSSDKANYIANFIPNTYEFYWSATPEEFTQRMKKEHEKFWSDTKRQERAKKLGYTPNEIVTIASIVNQETNAKSEMDEVAGVYINRLRIGMPLQADPTVKFAIGDFGIKRVLNKHLEYDSPYNTYKYNGLPPGPICAPSIAAIDATLNYADGGHNYLYFCANPDFSGTHVFARTLSAHNNNARAYQRELNRRKIR